MGRLLFLNFDAYALLREALMFPYNERTTSFSSIAFPDHYNHNLEA